MTPRRITASLGTVSSATHTREVRVKDGKRTYPRVKKSVDVPWEEWIGVPVPDPGIPREWVLAARDAIKDNEKVSNCG